MLIRTPRRRERLDAVTFLTVYLVALFAIESRLVVGPLGGAGQPAGLLGLVGLGWWMYHHTQRSVSTRWQVQPVRLALVVFLLAVLASFAAAMSRPINSDEVSSATLGLVALLGWLGIALLAHDGITSQERFEVLVRRLVTGVALLALLGMAQYVFSDSLVRHVPIPGLRPNLPLTDLQARAGFTRPSGTALHPIEFGLVVTTVLPIAVTRAMGAPRRGRTGAWAAVFFILLGIVVSGSRSAVLSTAVGMAVLAITWTPRVRLTALVLGSGLMAFVVVTMPGMAGHLVRLFTGLSADGSVTSRTGSYTLVGEFFGHDPWIGRGFSTFLPSYRILDNQYLLLLVETGLVGLVSFLGLLAVAVWCARAVRLMAPDPVAAQGAQGLCAGVCAATAGFATFDGLSFPMGAGLLFLVLGLVGASYRLVRTPTPARGTRLKVVAPVR